MISTKKGKKIFLVVVVPRVPKMEHAIFFLQNNSTTSREVIKKLLV
jgi:hypothetical protein